MAEERTLAPEANQPEAVVEAEPPKDAPQVDDANGPTEDDIESLVEGLDEDAAKKVKTWHKKASDFDRMVSKKESDKPKRKPEVDVSEDKIRSVLYKDNEQKVLKAVVKEGDPMFIPELVDDKNWNAVLGYLPRGLDRSSQESIHRALKLAVRSWKEDNGIETKEPKADAAADLATSKRSGSGAPRQDSKPSGRKFLRKAPGIDSWYSKE